tara:strand:- start:163 stop:579 length:417 start_codon:yes stop_codon:yes gene_type:complete
MNLVEISNNFCISYLACIRRIAAKLNLSLPQALCLNAIPFNGISQANLAKILAIDISTLSRNLEKLRLLGLISKTSSNIDKRSYKIGLTNQGEALYKQFNIFLIAELTPIYSEISLNDQDILEETLNKLNWQIELLNK